jgi:hypothetical protein
MGSVADPADVEGFLPVVVVLLKNVADSIVDSTDAVLESEGDASSVNHVTRIHESLVNMNTIMASVLHDFRLSHARAVLDNELGFWVLSRSTAWFSQFFLHEYDDRRWIMNFRFTKAAIFQMAALLAPHCGKMDTRYRKAIPICVRIAYAFYKLAHSASLLICSEFFAIGKFTVSGVLRDVVHAVNDQFRSEIAFPRGPCLTTVMNDFHDFCGLSGVAGAIDGTHVHIRKPFMGLEDYFYFKTSGYSIQVQAIVDRQKRFVDLAVGMPGSTHDSRMLRLSTLYHEAENGTLFDPAVSMEGFSPYLLGDSGYLLKQWLLIPYRDGPGRGGQQSVLERLFNKHLSRGRSVVENAFGILKQTFRELLDITDLHVTFVPDAVVCCCLLHNVLLGQDPGEVARLLEILQHDGMIPAVDDNP